MNFIAIYFETANSNRSAIFEEKLRNIDGEVSQAIKESKIKSKKK